MADFIRFAGSVPRKENEIMVEYIELNDALAGWYEVWRYE